MIFLQDFCIKWNLNALSFEGYEIPLENWTLSSKTVTHQFLLSCDEMFSAKLLIANR